MSQDAQKKGLPYWLLLAYFFFEFVRPQTQFLPFLSPLRIPGILEILLPVVWFVSLPKEALRERPVRYAIGFLLTMAVTVIFAINGHWVFQRSKAVAIMMFAGMLPAAALLVRSDRMAHFLRFWVVTQTLVALACLLNGGVGTGSFLFDENDLALALCMAIPYPFFLRRSPLVGKATQWFYLGATGAMILGVAATRSRGGFLGLVALLGVMWLWSKNRVKNAILILAVATAGSGILVASAPEGYFDEMATISDTQDSTRLERLKSWGLGWDMFVDNPILGVGAGNYPWTVHTYQLRRSMFSSGEKMLGGREAHSLYFTLLPELGLVGTLLFIGVLLSLNRRLKRLMRRVETSSRESDQAEEFRLAALAMRCSMVTFLINAVFISVLYYPHLWYLVGFTVALERALEHVYSERNVTLSKPELVLDSELPPVPA
ncbi:MAG: O-antigen ligase family protein [Myxococcota bacterium]